MLVTFFSRFTSEKLITHKAGESPPFRFDVPHQRGQKTGNRFCEMTWGRMVGRPPQRSTQGNEKRGKKELGALARERKMSASLVFSELTCRAVDGGAED